MRWLIVLPFDRPDHMGVDFRNELLSMGHGVRTFAYRRNNPLYKNRGTKAAYQLFILRRLERLCHAWRPSMGSRPTTSSSPRSATLWSHSRASVSAIFTTFPCTVCPPCIIPPRSPA